MTQLVQQLDKYTHKQHSTWEFLYERQSSHLRDKASVIYLSNLDQMLGSLTSEKIPVVKSMTAQLSMTTGWSIEIVPGLIPVEDFFKLLSEKKFCTSVWVRRQDQVDYIEEPDMFHDTFGHIPPLMDDSFASFMHRFGKIGAALAVIGKEEELVMLQRLYWFFVEFGFVREKGEPKLFGAGIMSSHGETNHAWSMRGELLDFDLAQVMSTEFRSDVIQDKYFILDSIPQLEVDLDNWYKTII
jgi:phenylalanine-4-hydroxylase